MTNYHSPGDPRDRSEIQQASPERPEQAAGKKSQRSKSMHDGIAVWCDCCSCEAEPYWAELAEEMGIDLGSDYEDPEPARDE